MLAVMKYFCNSNFLVTELITIAEISRPSQSSTQVPLLWENNRCRRFFQPHESDLLVFHFQNVSMERP